MHHLRLATVGALLAGALARASAPPPPETTAEKPVPTVLIGQIFVIGNTATPQQVILDTLDLYSGGRDAHADLRRAERRLEKLRIFQVDRRKGIRPTVTFIPNTDGTTNILDLLVQIEERPGNELVYRFERLVEDGLRWLGGFQR